MKTKHEICEKCNDTGEYEAKVNGIVDIETGENTMSFKHFCECKTGQKKARLFNNGRNGGKYD